MYCDKSKSTIKQNYLYQYINYSLKFYGFLYSDVIKRELTKIVKISQPWLAEKMQWKPSYQMTSFLGV